MGYRRPPSFGQMQPRLTSAVKGLLIAVVVVFIAQLSFEKFGSVGIERLLAFSPVDFMHGYVWQLLTYPFLHGSLSHLFFNALMLYMIGAELELRWGTVKFLKYYFVCGVGGAILQTLVWLGALTIAPEFANYLGKTPVIGASGAIYGLFMAYGYLYGEQVTYVMFVVPMRVRNFVALLFFVEIVSAVFYSGPGTNGGFAHLVHIGGLITGFIYLRLYGGNLDGRGGGFFRKRGGRMDREELRKRLSVIVNDDPDKKKDGKFPITWN